LGLDGEALGLHAAATRSSMQGSTGRRSSCSLGRRRRKVGTPKLVLLHLQAGELGEPELVLLHKAQHWLSVELGASELVLLDEEQQ
jgi:hypothetical protein